MQRAPGVSWVQSWAEVTDKPADYAHSAHLHSAADITGGTFDAALIPTLDINSMTSGLLDVARGGTGWTSLTPGRILVGNGTNALLMPTILHWDPINEHFGIGTASPSALLHTNGTEIGGGNVLFEGFFKLTTPSFGPGDPPASGAGTRMMWYPDKGAFRAGRVLDNNWDKDEIGNYSVAMGYNTKASGSSSTAMGNETTASQNGSTAMGFRTTSSGPGSTAMGYLTIASGDQSTAMGFQTTASGWYSIATGSNTKASGGFSTAMGRNARAVGEYSFAINLNYIEGPEVPANRFQISGASAIGGNLAWTNWSDKRLKKEIQHLETENNLEKILKLKGVRFKWNESNPGNDLHYLGFLAQDVMEILPETVLHDDLNDIYSIEYTSLIPVLVEGIKEQQAIIEAQQKQIDELKDQFELLKSMMQLKQ